MTLKHEHTGCVSKTESGGNSTREGCFIVEEETRGRGQSKRCEPEGYFSRKRELKTRLKYEVRCDERLKN